MGLYAGIHLLCGVFHGVFSERCSEPLTAPDYVYLTLLLVHQYER